MESGNAEVLKRVQKGITLDQVERAVVLAKDRGLRVWCKFILGHTTRNETGTGRYRQLHRTLESRPTVRVDHDSVPGYANPRHGDSRGRRIPTTCRWMAELRQVLFWRARAQRCLTRILEASADLELCKALHLELRASEISQSSSINIDTWRWSSWAAPSRQTIAEWVHSARWTAGT